MPNTTNSLLISSEAPSFFEDTVTFTTTVTAAPQLGSNPPTGTVTFFDGLITLATVGVVPTSPTSDHSVATLDITTLAIGTHSISAVYSGDGNYSPSTSNTVLQQVNALTAPTNTVPPFCAIASFTPNGDTSLPPQATLFAVPANTTPHHSVTLLWDTINVAQIEITGNNGVDPAFDTGLLTTAGSGAYVVGNGFLATITLLLTAYDRQGNPLGLTSQTTVVIS